MKFQAFFSLKDNRKIKISSATACKGLKPLLAKKKGACCILYFVMANNSSVGDFCKCTSEALIK